MQDKKKVKKKLQNHKKREIFFQKLKKIEKRKTGKQKLGSFALLRVHIVDFYSLCRIACILVFLFVWVFSFFFLNVFFVGRWVGNPAYVILGTTLNGIVGPKPRKRRRE